MAVNAANLAAVKMLVGEGGALVTYKDRWGHTALDEAVRNGNQQIREFLEPLTTKATDVSGGLQTPPARSLDCAACWPGSLSHRF